MPSRKKQRTVQSQPEPLGSRFSRQNGASEATEEELALATSLFGRNADIPVTSKGVSFGDDLSGPSRDIGFEDSEKTGLEDVEDDQVRPVHSLSSSALNLTDSLRTLSAFHSSLL